MKILYVQYVNPGAYPPLEHSSRILAGNGWEVLFLGIGALGSANQLQFPRHQKIQVRLLKYCAPGWRQKLHFFRHALWSLAWTLRWRPKWIYASDLLSCPVALLLSFLPGRRVIYHEHDSPEIRNNKSDPRPPTSAFQLFLLWCRKQLARRATFCILPNQQRIELFKDQTGTFRPVLCVWNCPRLEEVRGKAEIENQKLKLENGPAGLLRLAYHGSINSERLPLTVLEAMSRFPGRVRLSVAGYETLGSRGYVAEFLQKAEQLGLAQAVEFLGALPRCELFVPASRCAVGLAFMPLQGGDVNMTHMTGASNKPFDYLACGLALLVSDLPDWREMFVQPGYGLACDPASADSIAAQLRRFIEQPGAAHQMGERGRQRILKAWNYEMQLESVLEFMDQGNRVATTL